jgi:hypothetical protein
MEAMILQHDVFQGLERVTMDLVKRDLMPVLAH